MRDALITVTTFRPTGQNSCQGATTTTHAGRVDIYDDGQQASMGAPQAVRKGLKVLPGVAGGGAPAARFRQSRQIREVDGEEEVAERRARATDGEETEVVEVTDRWEGLAA